MLNRRDFLKVAGLIALAPHTSCTQMAKREGILVNDIQSQLNPTRVDRVVAVDSLDAVRRTIKSAGREGKAVSIAGGRHAINILPLSSCEDDDRGSIFMAESLLLYGREVFKWPLRLAIIA